MVLHPPVHHALDHRLPQNLGDLFANAGVTNFKMLFVAPPKGRDNTDMGQISCENVRSSTLGCAQDGAPNPKIMVRPLAMRSPDAGPRPRVVVNT